MLAIGQSGSEGFSTSQMEQGDIAVDQSSGRVSSPGFDFLNYDCCSDHPPCDPGEVYVRALRGDFVASTHLESCPRARAWMAENLRW